jgi:hypothetical protein
MAEYKYSISLRVEHPTMDLDAVTEALGLSPQVIWKVGQPRRTPKGTPLPGIYKKGFWTARLLDGASIEQDLSSALSKALELVAAGSPLFGEIALTGGSTEFFVGWFFDEGNSGDVLDHRMLAKLASMSINLSFDVYGDTADSR